MLTALHTALFDVLNQHDWSSAFADGVDVVKTWDAELRHEQIDPLKARIDVVPWDLSTQRVDAVSFLPQAGISVTVRGRAATEARTFLMCDFAEAVVDLLTEIPPNVLPWEILSVETMPLVELSVLKTHRIWFSMLQVRFGYEVKGA